MYGGSGIVYLLDQLFQLYSRERLFPGNAERALLLICIFKKGDRDDSSNDRGITLSVL